MIVPYCTRSTIFSLYPIARRLSWCFVLIGCLLNLAWAQSTRPAWTTSRIHGRPVPPEPYVVTAAFPGLSFHQPTSLTEIPGCGRLMVGQGGQFLSFENRPNAQTLSTVCDLNELTGTSVAISSAVFDPAFEANRHVYFCYRANGRQRVTRFALDDSNDPRVLPETRLEIIDWPSTGHTGGCLHFGRDGMLYISTGDSSGPAPPDGRTTGQDISDLLGAMLRIDVRRAEQDAPYRIPKDNPFVDVDGARAEVWAYGLRNPWKFAIDRVSGDVYVADNGWETWESVHKLHSGSNAGWPIVEGRALLRTEVPRGPTPITPPIKDHPHTEANSVIGGPVYRSARYPDLIGAFIYGDYITGTIWSLKPVWGSDEYEHRVLADTDLHIVDFLEDSHGNVYLLDHNPDTHIFQMLPSDAPDTSTSFPRKLSETGLFRSTSPLEPHDGVMAYQIVAPRWIDGADTRRWIAVPGMQHVEIDAADPKQTKFPDGTVMVKQVDLSVGDRRVPIETQLLHREKGVWYPYSYVWNEEASDATLAPTQGTQRVITVGNPLLDQTWHVSSENECRLCHSAASGYVLGFTARQLGLASSSDSQLNQLRDRQLIRVSNTNASAQSRLVHPLDAHAELDDRARSYLHVNCGVCHRKEGPATVSFYAHRDYPMQELRITKRPGIGTFDIESPRLVSPGEPFRSIILYRMAKLGYGRMPYVGSHRVDGQGVALIAQWIASMEKGDDLVLIGDLSNETIDELLETTSGALQLAVAMHRGDVSTERARYVLDRSATKNAYIRGLFDDFLPESQRRKTVGSNPDVSSLLSLAGDARRGALIFHSDNARCRACHDPTDAEKSIGPTLASMKKKYQRPVDLWNAILRPSDAIDEPFVTWTVVTENGRTISGIRTNENGNAIQLRLADGRQVSIPQSDVVAMRKDAKSLMPDGTLADLTPQEAADLVAFLMQGNRP